MTGVCAVCGCTGSAPCFDADTGETCAWAEPDFCSFCAELGAGFREPEPLIVTPTEYEAQQFIEARRVARGAHG